MRQPTRIHLSEHAIQRFRERWPDCAYLPAHVIRGQVSRQVVRGGRAAAFITTPGGDYYPICFFGRDGYAIYRAGQITTILPEEYCPEVSAVHKRLRH